MAKLRESRSSTATRVLGDYIGNRMIGIKNIAKFRIFVGGQLKLISLNERKAAEKGWSKILTDCRLILDKIEEEVKKLEILMEKLKLP